MLTARSDHKSIKCKCLVKEDSEKADELLHIEPNNYN